ncbi:unnamed protein product, partial [marine sediment metagenome]
SWNYWIFAILGPFLFNLIQFYIIDSYISFQSIKNDQNTPILQHKHIYNTFESSYVYPKV